MFNVFIATLLGALFTLALSQGGAQVNGWPAVAVCALIVFGVQWLAFIPAYLKQTERFYDVTGSLTYISCTLLALSIAGFDEPRALLLAGCVLVWAARLGTFLFRRVHQDGGDGRFDDIKPKFSSFLTAWTLQGLWVLVTASAAWTGMLSARPAPLSWVDLGGALIWLIGFTIEVTADRQKRAFRARHGAGRFIQEGLWRYSRHPNYFGEVTLWVGTLLIALPALSGWQHLSALSPVFVYLLLTRVSGVPMLEERARARWGDDPAYQAYVARTFRMLPWPKSSEGS